MEAIQYPDAVGGVGAPELEMEEAKKARERRQDLAIGVGMEEKGTFNCFCHACVRRETEGGGGKRRAEEKLSAL